MAKKKTDDKATINSYNEVVRTLKDKDINITVDDIFNAGLKNIKRIDDNIISEKWDKLKNAFKDTSTEVFVRSHGRNGSGNKAMMQILKEMFGREFTIDPSNNSQPKKILKDSFKNTEYQDYQISHLFEGRTNNPLLFGAPWMICLCPKIIDPFTGHESNGFPQFRKQFIEWAYKTNKNYIEDYNELIRPYWKKLNNYINKQELNKTEKRMILALAPIKKDYEKLTHSKKESSYLKDFKQL